jgi:hypothetical protein
MRSALTRNAHVPFRTVGRIKSTERFAIDEGFVPRALMRPLLVLGGVLLAALIFQLAALAWLGSHHTLSDVPHLYGLRGIRPWAPPYFSRNIEYPVLIAFTMYAMSFAGGGALGFFLAGAVISGVLAVVVAVVLEWRGSPHLWRWVAGLPVFLFVFHNWDLLAIAPAVAGLAVFERDRNASAGVLIGLGTAAKLFPAVFLPPLVALRLVQRRPREAVRLAVSAAMVLLFLNLPVFIAEPQRWRWMYEFQGARPATWGSLWFYLVRLPGLHALAPPAAANLISIAAVVIGVATLTRLAVVRSLGAFEVGAAATAIFLLSNKVYSPGYDLWLVPFFAALLIPRRWWVLFCVADLGVYFIVYGNTRLGLPGAPVRVLVCCFVLLRAVSIIAVIVTSVRRRMTAAEPAPDRQTVHR